MARFLEVANEHGGKVRYGMINIEDIGTVSPPKGGRGDPERECWIKLRGEHARRYTIVNHTYEEISRAIQILMTVDNAILNVRTMRYGPAAGIPDSSDSLDPVNLIEITCAKCGTVYAKPKVWAAGTCPVCDFIMDDGRDQVAPDTGSGSETPGPRAG